MHTMHRIMLTIAASAASAVAPMTAVAQDSDRHAGVSFGVSGGATMPFGDYADIAKTGWNAGAFVDFGRVKGPVGMRADFLYHGFGDKSLVTTAGGGTTITFSNKYSITSGSLNLVIGLPLESSPIRPYVIGGGGAYYVKNSQKCNGVVCALGLYDTGGGNTKFGLNGGGGIEFGMGSGTFYAEARLHNIFSAVPKVSCFGESGCARTAAQLVPLNIGLKLNF